MVSSRWPARLQTLRVRTVISGGLALPLKLGKSIPARRNGKSKALKLELACHVEVKAASRGIMPGALWMEMQCGGGGWQGQERWHGTSGPITGVVCVVGLSDVNFENMSLGGGWGMACKAPGWSSSPGDSRGLGDLVQRRLFWLQNRQKLPTVSLIWGG